MTTWNTVAIMSGSFLKDCGRSLLFKVSDGRTFFHPKKLCHPMEYGYDIVFTDGWEWRLSRKRHGYGTYETETVDTETFLGLLSAGCETHHVPERLEPETCEALEELIDDGED